MKVRRGGPATVNGVLYQLLWTLFRTATARVQPGTQGAAGALQEAVLTIEPCDGGDLRIASPGDLVIEQIKARPDSKRPWSLREMLTDVIPDLYVAGRMQSGVVRYRFVTEGRKGDWRAVEACFRQLGASTTRRIKSLTDLDNDTILYRPSTTGAFWKQKAYTERDIYELVVDQIQRRMTRLNCTEPRERTVERLQDVLESFEFLGDRRADQLRQEIDGILQGFVDRWEDVAPLRDRMLHDLGRLAVRSIEISASEFFDRHGLRGVSVHEWATLLDRARGALVEDQKRWRYSPEREVRPDQAPQAYQAWPADTPVLVIQGEMGQGKSWLANALLAHTLASSNQIVAIVACGRDAESTLARAADRVWRDIAGRSSASSFAQIGALIRGVLQKPHCQWLTLAIDDVSEVEQARQLVGMPWRDWGIRMVLTCSNRVADRLGTSTPRHPYVVAVRDFTEAQVRRYLRTVVGRGWSTIPEDLRETLQKPIIAETFRQIVEDSGDHKWLPESEYEIFHRLWQRLEDRDGALLLVALVRQVLKGQSREWDAAQLHAARIDPAAIKLLREARWLQGVGTGGRYAIPHDRLLSWAIAEVLAMDLRAKPTRVVALGRRLRSFLFEDRKLGGFHPGYVALDTLWLIAGKPDLQHVVPALLAAMEPGSHDLRGFYEELVPTLGARIVPALVARRAECEEGSIVAHHVEHSITRIGGPAVAAGGIQLLRHEQQHLQIAGARLLAQSPTSEAIDDLWGLFLRAKTAGAGPIVESAVFRSLRACARLEPEWIDAAIKTDKGGWEHRSDLVWLIVGLPLLDGQRLWNRHKERLLAEPINDHGRCLTVCLSRFQDANLIHWLLQRLEDEQLWIQGVALLSLSILAPQLAIKSLSKVPSFELYANRNLYGDRLFLVDAPAMRSQMRQTIADSKSPWAVAQVYQGREHWADAETVDALLDRLSQDLRRELSTSGQPAGQKLWHAFRLLVACRTTTALQAFRQRSSSPLVQLLVRYLHKIGPDQSGGFNDGTCREEILEILGRINPHQFTRAVNAYLKTAEGAHLLRVIALSARCRGQSTIRILRELVKRGEEPGLSGRVAEEAAKSLLELGEWQGTIDLMESRGLGMDRSFMNWPRQGIRPSERLLARVREAVRKKPTPGAVMALGFGTSGVNGGLVRNLLLNEAPETDLAHACVIALDLMEDGAVEVVPAIARQFAHGREHAATNALLTNGSASALAALRHAAKHHDIVTRVNLINQLDDSSIAESCIRWLTDRASNGGDQDLAYDLRYFLSAVRDDDIRKRITSVAALREFCESRAYCGPQSPWRHSRPNAVWCLIQLDPTEGREAALAATSLDAGDRRSYPYALVKFFHEDAAPALLDQLKEEADSVVAAAIGRALSTIDVDNAINQRLGSADVQDRKAGCTAAGWASRSSGIATELTRLLSEDADSEVSDAAVQALTRIRRRAETKALAERVATADDHFEKWQYLDALIEFADPGDEFCEWPVEGPSIIETLTPRQRSHLRQRLKDRRQRMSADLRWSDRRTRD